MAFLWGTYKEALGEQQSDSAEEIPKVDRGCTHIGSGFQEHIQGLSLVSATTGSTLRHFWQLFSSHCKVHKTLRTELACLQPACINTSLRNLMGSVLERP